MKNEKCVTRTMVNEINNILANEGSCLRYIKGCECVGLTSYDLVIVDKFIDKKYINIPIITQELDDKIRSLFKKWGVEDTGYMNTIKTIFVR